MKARVLPGRCAGHARCAAIAPATYLLDDDGYVLPVEVEIAPDQEDLARRGARACPERAIEIVDERD